MPVHERQAEAPLHRRVSRLADGRPMLSSLDSERAEEGNGDEREPRGGEAALEEPGWTEAELKSQSAFHICRNRGCRLVEPLSSDRFVSRCLDTAFLSPQLQLTLGLWTRLQVSSHNRGGPFGAVK